jgi:hypothetical protein
MASYPRREKAEAAERARAARLPALDCQACGALTPGTRFVYRGDWLVCEACEERNPPSRRLLVAPERLLPRDIKLNFLLRDGIHIQAMALDCRTMLGPYVRVATLDTVRRLLTYLGATEAQLADFDRSYRNWGQGTTRITLQPCRKNLLRLRG